MKRLSYPWVAVLLLLFVWMMNYLDRQAIFSLFPLLRASLHMSDLQEGLLGTAFLWTYAGFSPFCGFFADRYGSKRLIVLSLLIWSAVTWLTGCAHSFRELLLARGAMGLSEACYLPAGLGLIAAYHGEATRSRATGIHYAGGYVGTVLGGILAGWMGERYGWRPVFLILGAAGVVYGLLLVKALREPDNTPRRESRPKFLPAMKMLIQSPGFWIVFAVFGLMSVSDWAIYTWMPFYLFERFHMTLAEAGWSATFYMRAGGLLGVFAGAWLADAWTRTAARGRVFTQCLGVLCGSPFLMLAGLTQIVPLLLAAMLIFGIGKGMYDCNVMPVLCELVPEETRSTGFGLLNCIGPVMGGLTASIAGLLHARIGLGAVFTASGLLALISGFALFGLHPRRDTAQA